ncbi:hypothetical protein CIP100629_02147 [Corynebacterium diphtheriae]|nr:hypothetical protein CIP100629_02147 [Corynebacterium diphtheriae]CAB0871980.1 hypothetical protein FRC0370_01968 [Corynebacterium diphtheriae]CAB0968876.1 hypothetical protein FRC0463_01966 [Corynebacterium diphtheriae]
MNPIDKLLDLPTPALIGVCILIGVQLAAVVWSLICLLRDKRAHIAGLNRLVWLLVIIFGQVIGPIVFWLCTFTNKGSLKCSVNTNRRLQPNITRLMRVQW